jgi:hypothetical protein
VIGALALAAGLLTADAHAAGGERRYAIVVGVNSGDPDEEPLLFAERDAERVAQVLVDLAGVHEEDLVLLRGGDERRVARALEQVAVRVEREREDSDRQLLFVYYSGHADAAALHLGGSHLELRRLSELVEAVPVDVRVMVVDACRSGELTRLKGGVPVEPFAFEVQDRLESEGLAIITSSSAGEDAQESDRLRGGVFTHHFVAGLEGAADHSGDGRVTLTEAYRYSYKQTLNTTSRAPVVQHPAFAFDLRGRDDLVLTEPSRSSGRGWIDLPEGGLYLVFDASGTGDMVAEAEVPDGARLAVEPGTYVLRRRESDMAWQTAVNVVEGEVVAVAEMEPVPYGATVRKGLSQKRAAVGVQAGGGLGGPLLAGQDPLALGYAGARFDLESFTLMPRVRYSLTGAENADLSQRQQAVGLDLAAVKLLDLGRFSPGLGLRGGLDGVWQTFETRGQAPPMTALVGRTGPLLRLEYAPAARWLVGLELGAEMYLLRELDAGSTFSTPVVPYAALDLARY